MTCVNRWDDGGLPSKSVAPPSEREKAREYENIKHFIVIYSTIYNFCTGTRRFGGICERFNYIYIIDWWDDYADKWIVTLTHREGKGGK